MSESSKLNYSIYIITILIIFFGMNFLVVLESKAVNIFCIILLGSFGLLHGSNDILLQSKNSFFNKITYGYRFLIYVATVGILFFSYYNVPVVALILFIIYSCYHFGEQHLISVKLKNYYASIISKILCGSIVFSILFLENYNEVKAIFNSFDLLFLSKNVLAAISLLFLTLFIAFIFAMNAISKITWKKSGEIGLHVLFLLFLFCYTNLIVGFTTYFILWHSIPSIYSQILVFRKTDANYSLSKYIKHSRITYGLSLIGLCVLVYLIKDTRELIKILIIASAAITLPHIVTISSVFTKNDSEK